MRRSWILLILTIVIGAAVAAVWAGTRKLEENRIQFALEEAKKEMAAKRYALAFKRLSALESTELAHGEVEYQLGVCEASRGHRDQALSIWERIAPESPFAAKAAVQRGMLCMTAGQFSRAEDILSLALKFFHGHDLRELYKAMELLYQLESRTSDLRRLVLDSWQSTREPADVLEKMWRVDTAPLPLDFMTKSLQQADSSDDRVWLARANLATRTGHFDEADTLLKNCSQKRPDDPVVWRARLELAQARGDGKAAWSALERLPAATFSSLERLRLRAWLAEQKGDARVEKAALDALSAREPGDTSTLERLAALAASAGDAAEVARLRSLQTKMTAAKQKYKALLKPDWIADPSELAKLAETLGRDAEARGWSLIRDGKVNPPEAGRLSIDPDAYLFASATPLGQSLADVCGDLRPADAAPALHADTTTVIPRYIDQASSAGLTFIQENGATAQQLLPETMSGGVALIDYDRDGRLDVYLVQAGAFPPKPSEACADRLFRNRGDGTFEDTTGRAGIAKFPGGYGHGIAVGDYDNDGDPDLFVTRWNAYALYRNKGDGTFEDATSAAGLSGPRDWPTSAAWADLDNDGDLDLYVCHYLEFDIQHQPDCFDSTTRKKQYCSPVQFASLADHVFRNDRGRFTDITKPSEFVDPHGRGLGVIAAQLDDDDRIDLYVANDMSANYLFRNQGGLRFEEVAIAAGAAANSSGGYQSGMGIACGDIDNDGRPEIAVTNFFGESTTLFHNDGHGLFSDRSSSFGLAVPTRHLLGFGVAFLDANNDGYLDLLSANGHVSDLRPVFPWKMPIQSLLGQQGGRFDDISTRAGEPFQPLHLGRGLAVGDIDNDGRTDAIIVSQNEELILLANRTETAGHWLTIQLEGVQSNRDAVGARVEVQLGDRHLFAQRVGGGSYQSANDARLHFGLGRSSKIEGLVVRWPSGQVDRFTTIEPDRAYLLREGRSEPRILWQKRE